MNEYFSRIHNILTECFLEKSSWSWFQLVSVVRQLYAVTLPQVHLCCRLCHTGVPIHCPSALLVNVNNGDDGVLRLPLNTSSSARAMYGPPTELVTGTGKKEPAVEPRF